MYFTHSGFPKGTFRIWCGDDGEVWIELSRYHKIVFEEDEARQVIEGMRRALGDEIDTPPSDDPADIHREAYFAGMADGPAPGAD